MGGMPTREEATIFGQGNASNTTTAADQDLLIDSVIVPSGKHWIVQAVSALANFTTNNPSTFTPLTGIFLCPPGSPGDVPHNAGFSYNAAVLAAYPIRIDDVNQENFLSGAPGKPFMLVGKVDFLVVPAGWFLRAAFGGANGTAGVGAGSTGQLNFSYVQRDNC